MNQDNLHQSNTINQGKYCPQLMRLPMRINKGVPLNIEYLDVGLQDRNTSVGVSAHKIEGIAVNKGCRQFGMKLASWTWYNLEDKPRLYNWTTYVRVVNKPEIASTGNGSPASGYSRIMLSHSAKEDLTPGG